MDIQIGNESTALVLPRSATARFEIVQALGEGQTVPLRVAAAAVGLGWPSGPRRPRARYSGDVQGYGGEVADELLERGATMVDIVRAGAKVIEGIARDGIPGLREAKQGTHPTEPPAAA